MQHDRRFVCGESTASQEKTKEGRRRGRTRRKISEEGEKYGDIEEAEMEEGEEEG